MAAGTVFEFVARKLEEATDFDRLEARGTVRLALKESGIDAKSVTVDQMTVVLQKVLPGELETRGIDGSDSVCEGIAQLLKGSDLEATADPGSPEAVFRRIGGR
jgi:hypothetical protein